MSVKRVPYVVGHVATRAGGVGSVGKSVGSVDKV